MNRQVILCVDDEVIVLDALKEQLQQEFGNEILIEIAEGGNECLDIFDELVSDGYEVPIVIADFIMPGMKGDDLLSQIHKKSSSTRKVMLTGQASLEGVSNAVNRAALYRYISKPWDKEDLFLTIREALKSFNQEKTIINQNVELVELNAGLEKKVEQRTSELQELNATKDKFFSIIAHDLKNPFNTIIGFSELLVTNFSQFTQDQIKEYIYILFDTSLHAYDLLENLLDWSRSQTGRITIRPVLISLHIQVSDIMRLLENQAEKKKILLKNTVDESVEAFADVNMINTVLRNLISNAIKYTKENGQIEVSASVNEKEVTVFVSDDGIGITPENMDKLFRIDKSLSTKGTANETGTGLGLILCKEFIEKNKGIIRVESTLGKGSKFIFTLPVKSPDSQS